MSFIRHEEIYPCDEGGYGEGAVPQDHALAHRNDESPAGYSSAGCSPAAPASASPAAAIILWLIFSTKFFAANGKLSPIPLSQLKGAVLKLSPIPLSQLKGAVLTLTPFLLTPFLSPFLSDRLECTASLPQTPARTSLARNRTSLDGWQGVALSLVSRMLRFESLLSGCGARRFARSAGGGRFRIYSCSRGRKDKKGVRNLFLGARASAWCFPTRTPQPL